VFDSLLRPAEFLRELELGPFFDADFDFRLVFNDLSESSKALVLDRPWISLDTNMDDLLPKLEEFLRPRKEDTELAGTNPASANR
jgi:hypothetical protein